MTPFSTLELICELTILPPLEPVAVVIVFLNHDESLIISDGD